MIMNMVGASPPAWFRIVAVLAVLWNCIGVWTYLSKVGMAPPMMEMSPDEVALAASMPSWATAGFAVAVFAGLLGSLGLLLGKAWARMLLILSLLGMAAQFGWWLGMSGAMERMGNSAAAMPAIVVLIGLLLVWLANTGVKKGWLT
jgi:hypothetical protein